MSQSTQCLRSVVPLAMFTSQIIISEMFKSVFVVIATQWYQLSFYLVGRLMKRHLSALCSLWWCSASTLQMEGSQKMAGSQVHISSAGEIKRDFSSTQYIEFNRAWIFGSFLQCKLWFWSWIGVVESELWTFIENHPKFRIENSLASLVVGCTNKCTRRQFPTFTISLFSYRSFSFVFICSFLRDDFCIIQHLAVHNAHWNAPFFPKSNLNIGWNGMLFSQGI